MFSWDDFPNYRISPATHSDLRHEDVVRELNSFHSKYPQSLQLSQLGYSVEGRSISLLTLGNGTKKVLAWSQMHGNEPTHTAVLLDLVNLLLHDPVNPTAQTILNECTLHLILMLNPDGAERWTRRNTQDIDVNRDALHLQSPEGQLLHDAVQKLQPDFALNLHNHRPHTTVGQTQQPASFSLLAPPVDAQETNTDNVRQAKQLAGYLAQAVESYCPGPVSRYNADFMPRCFGEWVQQQGAATLTIEAGGWSTVDAEPLVHLHFFGLVACLEAIATDSHKQVPIEVYEALPRTGEHDLFDKLLRDVTIINGKDQLSFQADLGINFCQHVPAPRGGTIVDLGDLHVTSGKQLTEASNLACVPGRIAWLPDLTPSSLCDEAQIAALLAAGVTTAVGQLDLTQDDQISELFSLRKQYNSPLNIGFLAKLTIWTPELLDRLVKAISKGVLGMVADGIPTEIKLYLSLFNFPLIPVEKLPNFNDALLSLADCASQTHQCAQLFDFKDRGDICLGAIADLALYNSPLNLASTVPLTECDLHRVIVGGNVVFQHGQPTGDCPGVLLGNGYT